MSGNTRKFWDKPGTIGRVHGRPGTSMGDFRDAVTIEDAVLSSHLIKVRAHREKSKIAAENRTAAERAKITLSSPEWIKKFMEDAPDETPE